MTIKTVAAAQWWPYSADSKPTKSLQHTIKMKRSMYLCGALIMAMSCGLITSKYIETMLGGGALEDSFNFTIIPPDASRTGAFTIP